MLLLSHYPALFVPLVDATPTDNDVKAGWTAFAIFIGLLIAVGLLGWSVTRHLRQVERNRVAGVYGDVEEPTDPFADPAAPTTPAAPKAPTAN